MITTAVTHVGHVRTNNQDSYVILPYEAGYLLIVADGMGGHRGGETASAMAVEIIGKEMKIFEGSELPMRTRMDNAIRESNAAVYHRSLKQTELSGMGTTLTMVYIAPEHDLTAAHIGDSRAYVLHNEKLKQVTVDHSVVQEMLRSGRITDQQVLDHPYRHIVTRALGTDSSVEADFFVRPFGAGDVLMLCSDGLINHVTDPEIEQVLSELVLEEAVRTLLELALQSGGVDNITILGAVMEQAAEESK